MSMACGGLSSPATAAGTVAVADAEMVAAMVLIQLAHPGAPVYHSMMPSLMDRMTEAGDDRAAYTRADLQLHALILEASHNELLARMSGTLADALQAGRDVTTLIRFGPASSVPLHADVVGTIVEAEPQQAHQAMLGLFSYATEDMEAVLDEDTRA